MGFNKISHILSEFHSSPKIMTIIFALKERKNESKHFFSITQGINNFTGKIK